MPRKKSEKGETVEPTVVSPKDRCMAYKQVFTDMQGQIVLADLLYRFGFTRKTTFDPDPPERTYLNEGQRSVLVYIGQMLDADPSGWEDDPQVEL